MTLQERLAMTQGQDNGMDIILGGIPAAAQQEQVQQLPATALRPKSNHTFKVRTGSPPLHGTGGQHPQQRHSDAAAGAA